ncbi:MAG: response regulator transcription factor [Gemmatimonadaceae bacterium]|nr:response regulator transcription factor [Gemmatimonadaceae bacterium]
MSSRAAGSGGWRVLVVDDEAPARAKLRRFLEAVPEVDTILEARDGHTALSVLRDDVVHVVFLDIQMPGVDGVRVAQSMAQLPQAAHTHVVFVTAFAQHAVDAFAFAALDYLLKPWDGDRFAAAIERIRQAQQTRADTAELAWHRRNASDDETRSPLPDKLVIIERGMQVVIPTNAIVWLEADRNHVVLHGVDRAWRTRGPLAALADAADLRRFRQVSRSAFVNLDAVMQLEPIGHGDQLAHLLGDHRVRVSRRYPLRLDT